MPMEDKENFQIYTFLTAFIERLKLYTGFFYYLGTYLPDNIF